MTQTKTYKPFGEECVVLKKGKVDHVWFFKLWLDTAHEMQFDWLTSLRRSFYLFIFEIMYQVASNVREVVFDENIFNEYTGIFSKKSKRYWWVSLKIYFEDFVIRLNDLCSEIWLCGNILVPCVKLQLWIITKSHSLFIIVELPKFCTRLNRSVISEFVNNFFTVIKWKLMNTQWDRIHCQSSAEVGHCIKRF